MRVPAGATSVTVHYSADVHIESPSFPENEPDKWTVWDATHHTQGARLVVSGLSFRKAAGYDCSAKGAEGCWLVLVEREDGFYEGGHIVGVQAIKVDGKRIKPGVAYKLVDGKVVAA